MISGFIVLAAEIFSGRGIALSLALGAMITGTLAIFGAAGIWPATSYAVQSFVFLAGSLAIFTALKMRANVA